ncbi:hypothetical protein [Microbacterium oleivorans]|uniref:Uncharacterized protein n=1 Tax=Microbacterium oleivorans TaxID=273677 RepID=A0A4V3B3P4_9MICO|nr:hypothetical protein [Microbacterium oleivorans]TDL45233.1 hypothetical protein E2R54_01820 [Microbacterium oleivorans]
MAEYVKDRAPTSAGLLLNRKTGSCGVCGQHRKLTKTHVPPQVAGNRGQVQRADVMSSASSGFNPERWRIGGMWVLGLCGECNSLAGARYDRAYADFADQLWSWLQTRTHLLLPGTPALTLAPGRVSRSILSGMLGISPNLREFHPTLAAQVAAGGPVRLPGGLRLWFAAYPGNRTQLTGPMLTGLVDGSGRAINTLAAVTFRPLTWALATSDSDAVMADQGWTDATDWLRYEDERERHDLRWLVPRGLTLIRTILHAPSDDAVVLYSKEIAPIMTGLIP